MGTWGTCLCGWLTTLFFPHGHLAEKKWGPWLEFWVLFSFKKKQIFTLNFEEAPTSCHVVGAPFLIIPYGKRGSRGRVLFILEEGSLSHVSHETPSLSGRAPACGLWWFHAFACCVVPVVAMPGLGDLTSIAMDLEAQAMEVVSVGALTMMMVLVLLGPVGLGV